MVMVILTRVNVGGVNNFAAGPLHGFTILFSLKQLYLEQVPSTKNGITRNVPLIPKHPFLFAFKNITCPLIMVKNDMATRIYSKNSFSSRKMLSIFSTALTVV